MRNYYLQFEEHGSTDNQSFAVNGSVAAAYQVQMSQVLQQHIGRPLVSSGKSSMTFITLRRVAVSLRNSRHVSQM